MTEKSLSKLTPAGRAIAERARERILFLDGAMGTTIQRYKLSEEDFRGQRWADYEKSLQGNNDLLSLTRPDIIKDIHLAYFRAGSDIVETNTFSSTTIAQADYGLESVAYELNVASARLAKEAANEVMAENPERQCYVAGAIGPTNRTASLSPDVNRPEYRNVTFEVLAETYGQQARGLLEGGADILMVETIFDTLNAKAAIFALEELFEELPARPPVFISGTITDQSGRTLSGQTTEAFWNSIRHARPLSVGMNCALGADLMRPYIEDLARLADCNVSCYPNAGLPDPLSPTGYPEGPEDTAKALEGFARDGLLNIVGGCCGTTPEHIAKIHEVISPYPPRQLPEPQPALRLSGLEPLVIR